MPVAGLLGNWKFTGYDDSLVHDRSGGAESSSDLRVETVSMILPRRPLIESGCSKPHCKVCSDSQLCYFCDPKYYLSAYSCVSTCSPSTYLVSALGVCVNCPTDCGKCEAIANSVFCTSCEELHKPVLYQGRCHSCSENSLIYYNDTSQNISALPIITLSSSSSSYFPGQKVFVRASVADSAFLVSVCEFTSTSNASFGQTDSTASFLVPNTSFSLSAVCDLVPRNAGIVLHCNTGINSVVLKADVMEDIKDARIETCEVIEYSTETKDNITLRLTFVTAGTNAVVKNVIAIDPETGTHFALKGSGTEGNNNNFTFSGEDLSMLGFAFTDVYLACELEPTHSVKYAKNGHLEFEGKSEGIANVLETNISELGSYKALHTYARRLRKAVDSELPQLNRTEGTVNPLDCYNSGNLANGTWCNCTEAHAGIMCQIDTKTRGLVIKRYGEIAARLGLPSEEEVNLALNVMVYITSYRALISPEMAENILEVLRKLTSTSFLGTQLRVISNLESSAGRELAMEKLFEFAWTYGNAEFNLSDSDYLYAARVASYGKLNYNFANGTGSLRFGVFPLNQATILLEYVGMQAAHNVSVFPVGTISKLQVRVREQEVGFENLSVGFPSPVASVLSLFPNSLSESYVQILKNMTALVESEVIICSAADITPCKTLVDVNSSTLICRCQAQFTSLSLLFRRAVFERKFMQGEVEEIIDIRRMGVVLLVAGIVVIHVVMVMYANWLDRERKDAVMRRQLKRETEGSAETLRMRSMSALVPIPETKYVVKEEIELKDQKNFSRMEGNKNDSFSDLAHANTVSCEQQTQSRENFLHWRNLILRAKALCTLFRAYFAADWRHNNLAFIIAEFLLFPSSSSHTLNVLIGKKQLLITLFWNEIMGLLVASGWSAQVLWWSLASTGFCAMFLASICCVLSVMLCTTVVGICWHVPEELREKINKADDTHRMDVYKGVEEALKSRQRVGWILVGLISGLGALSVVVWGFIEEIGTIYCMLEIFGLACGVNELLLEALASVVGAVMYALASYGKCIEQGFALIESYRMNRVLA